MPVSSSFLAPEASRRATVQLVCDAEHYDPLVQRVLLRAEVSVWVATANLKEMRVEAPIGTRARARGQYVSVLAGFEEMAARGVEIRVLHASVPSRPFRDTLRKCERLARGGLRLRRCPRVHLKLMVVDGRVLYIGSANFTGAGLGAKGHGRRNFEMGILTEDDVLLDRAQERFDRIWTGRECGGCRMRSLCPSPLDEEG